MRTAPEYVASMPTRQARVRIILDRLRWGTRLTDSANSGLLRAQRQGSALRLEASPCRQVSSRQGHRTLTTKWQTPGLWWFRKAAEAAVRPPGWWNAGSHRGD